MPSSTTKDSSSARFPEVGRGLALVVLIAVVYLPSVHAGILWDDDMLCTRNRLFLGSEPFQRIWFSSDAFDYFPLTWSMFYLEWRSFDQWLVGWHAVNIALHALNGALLYAVLRTLQIPAAWFIALAFGIHPVNVASVTWISQGKNTLSTLLYLLSTLCWLRWDDDRRSRWLGASLVCFTAALLSKTSGILLPVVLLACTWWRHQRLERRYLGAVLAFGMVAGVLGLTTVWFQHHRAMSEVVAVIATPATRIVAVGWIFWFYCLHILIPLQSMMVYPITLHNPLQFSVYGLDLGATWPAAWLADALLVAVAVIAWKRRDIDGRGGILALTQVFCMLLPCMGLIAMSYTLFSMVSDHLAYLACIGVIALPISALASRLRSRPVVAYSLALGLATILAALTLHAEGALRDREHMWRDNVRQNPTAWVAWFNLGSLLEDRHELTEAIDCYTRAARLKPDNPRVWYNLGHALAADQQTEKAIEAYRSSVRIDSDYSVAHNNLGTLLEQRNDLRAARDAYQSALRSDPNNAEAHNNLGALLARSGQPEAAIRELETALRLQPDNLGKADLLALLLARQGRVEKAVRLLTACLEARPEDVDMRVHLGAMQLELGRTEDAEKTAGVLVDRGVAAARRGDVRAALTFYRAAAAADHRYPLALNNVAWVLATARDDALRNPAEALELATRACQESGQDVPMLLDTLAAAYAANGDFTAAIATTDRGLAVARAQRDEEQSRALAAHRALYVERREVRE